MLRRKSTRRTKLRKRRAHRTRRRVPRKGGYSPYAPSADNSYYPTRPPTSYPVIASGALPDPNSTPNALKQLPSASGL